MNDIASQNKDYIFHIFLAVGAIWLNSSQWSMSGFDVYNF